MVDAKEEREMVIAKTQRLYKEKKAAESTIGASFDRGSYLQDDGSLYGQGASFLNYSARAPQGGASQSEYRGGLRGRPTGQGRGRPQSRTTVQMLNDSGDYSTGGDRGPESEGLDVTDLALVMDQERDPKRLRDFYRDFCAAVKASKQDTGGGEEINIHDVLVDLLLLGRAPPGRNREPSPDRDGRGVPVQAYSTEMIRGQRGKFQLRIESYARGGPGDSDDVVKNLFKILCGVMNMRLKQRAVNPLDDQTLASFLDAINFDILDDDLVLLTQMATMKRLANRKAFSISDKQIAMLHRKFANLYEQRMSATG